MFRGDWQSEVWISGKLHGSLQLIGIAWIGALIVPVIEAGVETLVPAIIGNHRPRSNNGCAPGIIYIFAGFGSTLGLMIDLRLLDASLMPWEGLYRACALLILAAVAVSVFTARKNSMSVSENAWKD